MLIILTQSEQMSNSGPGKIKKYRLAVFGYYDTTKITVISEKGTDDSHFS